MGQRSPEAAAIAGPAPRTREFSRKSIGNFCTKRNASEGEPAKGGVVPPPLVLFKAPDVLPSETTVSEDGPPANDAVVRRELAFSSPEADKGTSSTSAGNGRA